MASLLKPNPPSDLEEVRSDSALEYYAKHTAQIEVSISNENTEYSRTPEEGWGAFAA